MTILIRMFATLFTATGLATASVSAVFAQAFPTKPIKIIVPFLPGVNYPDLSASTILSGAIGR